VNREECSERIHLADEYSRLITRFNVLLDSLKSPFPEQNKQIWNAAELARALSQKAWDTLEQHIKEHQCSDLEAVRSNPRDGTGPGLILAMAALAALDLILVANDDRRYVDVNDAAAAVMGLSRQEIVGRRVEEFFPGVRGENAWANFIAEGVHSGICELTVGGTLRRFEYRAKANFSPGLHLGILREVKEEERR
jgi:PAS domain-containing protein